MRNAAEMFSFDPNPTTAKNAWPSSTCLLYGTVLDTTPPALTNRTRQPLQELPRYSDNFS
jgi:hypothetical protein